MKINPILFIFLLLLAPAGVARAQWEKKHKRKLSEDAYKRKLPERELAAAPQPPLAAVRTGSAGKVTDHNK